MADTDFTEDGLEEDFTAELAEHGIEVEEDASIEVEEQEPEAPVHEPGVEPEAPDPVHTAVSQATAGIRNELKSARQQSGVLESRMTQLLQTIQAAAQEPEVKPEPPKFDEDPEGSIQHMIHDAVAPVLQGQQAREYEDAQSTIDQYSQAIQEYVATDRDAFVEKTPDFAEAEQHLVKIERDNLRINNPAATDEQINAFLIQRFAQMQVQYYQAGKSMSEAVYNQAKLFGYQGNGTPERPRGKKAPVSAAQMKARQQGAKTISGAPPATPRKSVTTKDVIAMSDDEWDEYMSQFKDPDKVMAEMAKKYAVEI